MSYFKAKMHQIRFRLGGLRPRPRWGSSQRSPRPPNWIWGGSTSKGREGKGREGEGEEKEERGKEVKGEGEGKGEGCVMAFGQMDAPVWVSRTSRSVYTAVIVYRLHTDISINPIVQKHVRCAITSGNSRHPSRGTFGTLSHITIIVCPM